VWNQPGAVTWTFNPDWFLSHTKFTAVYGHLLTRADEMEWPPGIETYVKPWHPDCELVAHNDPTVCTFYIPGNATYWHDSIYTDWEDAPGRICLGARPTPECQEGGHRDPNWKFVIAHETGHRLADAMGGPLRIEDNYAHTASDELCRCTHVNSSNQLHCLQSREQLSGAWVEGWAHFWATAAFNNRDDGDGTFVYYKEVLIDPAGDPDPPPYGVDATNRVRWLQQHCSDDLTKSGVEWDWLVFLWHLWTTMPEIHRFSVDDIARVWRSLPMPQVDATWNDLILNVYDGVLNGQFTTHQLGKFFDEGDTSGVAQ
jgi:hypothetical protein